MTLRGRCTAVNKIIRYNLCFSVLSLRTTHLVRRTSFLKLPRKGLLSFALVQGVFAMTFPLIADAQQAKKVLSIGFLRVGVVPISKVFSDAMRDRSWIKTSR